MKASALLLVLLLAAGAAHAFTTDSYSNHARIMPDGSVQVNETIDFTLEREYNEGYRTIRPADAPAPEDVTLYGVYVDGKPVDAYVDTYQGDTEIVWTTTHEGKNHVELEYSLRSLVEEWDDFDRVCYEHYGADWPSEAERFTAVMDLPAGAAGKPVHFQIYSAKEGNASLEGLSVVTRIDNVPPGNYVGGCYLFPKGLVNASKRMNGSALAVLQDERQSYGSIPLFEPDPPTPFAYVCVPLVALLVLAAAASLLHRPGRKRLEESILPPSNEEPAVVAAIMRNQFPKKDVMAATILDLIDRGNMDIVELEKKGEASASVDRERTVLMLKGTDGLRPYERAVVDMIFDGKKEVVLDDRAKELDKMESQDDAMDSVAYKKMQSFTDGAKASMKKKGVWSEGMENDRGGLVAVLAAFGAMFGFFFAIFALLEYDNYAYYGELWMLWAFLASIPIGLAAWVVIGYRWSRPKPPKGHEQEFAQWDAFMRAVRDSRLKEYPPSSVAIWGKILVYATALGLADKVKKHLSELDSLTMERMKRMDSVRTSSYAFAASTIAVSNLAAYGNRSGMSSSSSGSSGGWSSGGGGGFSGGSSGGGGFR